MRLRQISISGYKTIRQLDGFEPRSLNILIGVNAAGKSNFIGFFRFLQWMLTPPGALQLYLRENGGASAFLHYGAERTQRIAARLEWEADAGAREYAFELSHAAGDTLVFGDERYRQTSRNAHSPGPWTLLPPGGIEAGLNSRAEAGDEGARAVVQFIRGAVVHQFHNTSRTSRMKQRWNADDNHHLKEDAANLGPFLLRLREHVPGSYRRIVETIRLVFPLFADFELNVTGGSVMLQWKERGSDLVFPAYQASDGLLRFFAMAALLLQPDEVMPELLLIDEPELGLHPHALEVLAGLLRKVSVRTQVIVSTQSAPFVSHFDPEDIVVVDRENGASQFRRLESEALSAWLQEYSLGELWQKNYIEGASHG